MDAYIALIILDLAKAIQENNLEVTKEKVTILNNNLDKITTNIDDLITSNHGNIALDNDSFNYVLDNALFFEMAELYSFRRTVRRLLLEQDELKIKNFILEILNNTTPNFKDMNAFYEDLILLVNQINDEDTFNKVKAYLESQVN